LGTALDGHDLCISFCFLFVFFVWEESYNNKWKPPASIFISGRLKRFDVGWVKSDEIHPFWELSHIPFFKGTCEDDVPFPKVGYVSSVEGKSKREC